MATEDRAPVKGVTDIATEVAAVEERVAETLKLIDTLSGGHPDRQLFRTTLLQVRELAREALMGVRDEAALRRKLDRAREVENEIRQKTRQRIANAQVRDQDQRRKAELKEKEQRRLAREAREEQSQKRKNERHKLNVAERSAALAREDEKHKQLLRERETNRKVRLVRDVAVICITIFCVLLSTSLVVVGVLQSQPIFLSGSGVSAVIAAGGITKLLFGWRNKKPQSTS